MTDWYQRKDPGKHHCCSLVNETGYEQGDSKDCNREHAVELKKILQLIATPTIE